MLLAYGRFLFKYRNALFPVLFLSLALFFPPTAAFGSAMADRLLDLAGFAVLLAGLAMRALVIGLEYIRRGGKDGKVYAVDLVTGGIFASCRNPLYVGNLLILAGMVLIWHNWVVYAVATLFGISSYIAIVAAEEDFLLDKFGDAYRAYCADVNRWLPNPDKLAEALANGRLNLAQIVVKDYNTWFTWFSTVLLLLFYERRSAAEYLAEAGSTGWIWGTMALLFVLYALVYFLKKSQRLNARGWNSNR